MRDRPCAQRPCSVFGLLFGGSTPCGVCGADPLAHCRAPNWPASKFSGSVGAIQRQTGAACPPPAGPLPPRTRTGRKLRSWWMPSGGRMTRSSLGCGRSAGPPTRCRSGVSPEPGLSAVGGVLAKVRELWAKLKISPHETARCGRSIQLPPLL